MSDEIRDVSTITFSGPRFWDAGLEADALLELLAYRKLLVETAKELWRDANGGLRLPRGFQKSIRLKFYFIESESEAIALKRVVSRDNPHSGKSLGDFAEIDDAALLIDETITAVSEWRPIPDRMPKRSLPLLAAFGKSLRQGESIETRAMRSATAAELTRETCRRLALLSGGSYEPRREAMTPEETTPRYFEIRDSAVAEIPAYEEETMNDTYDDAAKPLWQSIIDVSASVPPEEWDRVPKDLATNLDHYLYGRSREDE
ncbi:MAG TPA: hypothetical protein VNN25_21315 [Thermoanaerobaculia bacterium]|nr:hypothetical protein [Thermoanaerobaculia bacterium]